LQLGIKNEIEFKNLIDNKKVYELPKEIQKMLFYIFQNITLKDNVYCWRSKYQEKPDIKIRINKEIKGISIKSGNYCSMHQEHIDKFYPFLSKIGVDDFIIKIFDNYMKGIVNGKKANSEEFICNNIKDIQILKNKFNEYYVKTNLIIRFIFQGTEIQKYGCDALIYGTPNNFMWATKNEILKFLIEYKTRNRFFVNISALNIKCYDRNLRNNINRKDKQNNIQIKWYSIKNDFYLLTKIREGVNYSYD